MTCYEELKARGLIAQVTNEEEISKMVNGRRSPRWSTRGRPFSISALTPPPTPSTWATSWPCA